MVATLYENDASSDLKWTPNFRQGFKLFSSEDDGMAATNKRKVHSADFKENSHQTIKKPYSLTPPYPHPPDCVRDS